MKRLGVLVLILLVAGCSKKKEQTAPATPVQSSQATDKENVKKTFEAYRTALLNSDGQAAWAVVDIHTKQAYQEMVEDALTMKKEDIERLDFITRLIVLRMRLEFNKAELQKMDGKAIFVIGADKGWISKSTVESVSLKRIESDGTKAEAYITDDPIPAFHFLKENGEWKLYLLMSMELGNEAFKQIAKDQGISEKELIEGLLENISKYEFDDKLYDGPRE